MLSIVNKTSKRAATAFLNNSPFSMPATRSVEPTRPDVPADRDAIASRDSRPEERASKAQRRRARALLRGVRSPARVLRSVTPQEIARWNRPPPSDRKDFSLVPGSRQNRLAAKNLRVLRYDAAHTEQNTAWPYSPQNRCSSRMS